ncbi:20685_t:CDS:1, partial [Racocetra persica]
TDEEQLQNISMLFCIISRCEEIEKILSAWESRIKNSRNFTFDFSLHLERLERLSSEDIWSEKDFIEYNNVLEILHACCEENDISYLTTV